MSWHGHGSAMKMIWQCHGIAMTMPWQCRGNAMAMPRHCHGRKCHKFVVPTRADNWHLIHLEYILCPQSKTLSSRSSKNLGIPHRRCRLLAEPMMHNNGCASAGEDTDIFAFECPNEIPVKIGSLPKDFGHTSWEKMRSHPHALVSMFSGAHHVSAKVIVSDLGAAAYTQNTWVTTLCRFTYAIADCSINFIKPEGVQLCKFARW